MRVRTPAGRQADWRRSPLATLRLGPRETLSRSATLGGQCLSRARTLTSASNTCCCARLICLRSLVRLARPQSVCVARPPLGKCAESLARTYGGSELAKDGLVRAR